MICCTTSTHRPRKKWITPAASSTAEAAAREGLGVVSLKQQDGGRSGYEWRILRIPVQNFRHPRRIRQ
ncbi:hypothetical protein ACLB1N_03065 [Escherichia coli]